MLSFLFWIMALEFSQHPKSMFLLQISGICQDIFFIWFFILENVWTSVDLSPQTQFKNSGTPQLMLEIYSSSALFFACIIFVTSYTAAIVCVFSNKQYFGSFLNDLFIV